MFVSVLERLRVTEPSWRTRVITQFSGKGTASTKVTFQPYSPTHFCVSRNVSNLAPVKGELSFLKLSSVLVVFSVGVLNFFLKSSL